MKKTLIVAFVLAFVASYASADVLPAGDWKDLLHLGATADDHINGDGTDTDYLNGEATLMPAPGQAMTVTNDDGTEQTLEWTVLHDDDGRWTPPTSADHYIRYWHIYIISPEEREVTFQYGHDDEIRVWNNGELIITGGTSYDGVLHAGLNSIMIKLHEGGGGDYMKIAVTDRAGNSFTDLEYTFVPAGATLANPVTGSTRYTGQSAVDVQWETNGISVAGYQLTETNTEPTEWLTTAPTSYTLPDAEGDYTVYSWVKTDAGDVMSLPATITYTTLAPVVSAQDLAVEIAPDLSPAVVYPADADDGSYDPAGGELLTGAEYYYVTCDQDQTPDQPYITLDASAETQYMAVLTVTNEAGFTASVPFAVNIVAGNLPTTGPVVWDGDGGLGNQQWSRGQNWDLEQAPTNPTASPVKFAEFGGNDPDDNSTTNVVTPGAASVTTENAEPFAFDAADTLGVTVNGGVPQLVVITAADPSAATAQEVADSMNEFAIDFSALPTADGKVEITAADGSPSSLVFTNINGTPVETLGLPLDTPVVPEWTIGKLIVQKSTTPDQTMAADYSHTTDLNGSKLTIQQDFLVQYSGTGGDYGTVNYTLKNGYVQLGDPANLRNFFVTYYGGYSNGGATVTFAPGTKFEPYINVLKLNQCQKNLLPVTLDLRGVDIIGGVLKANRIQVGYNTNSATALMIDETTNLQSIEVAQELLINHRGEAPSTAYIGDPDNDGKLPADISFKLGNKDETGTISRANFYLGTSRHSGTIEGKLVASSGGDFEAYVNTMEVGTRVGTYHDYAIGLLDISKMNRVMIDATALKIGVGKDNNNAKVDGRIFLPSGGTMVVDSLTMGDISQGSMGLIDLPSASLTVNQTLAMKDNSKIAVHVQGSSCGIDLPAGIVPSITGTAVIEINFEQDQNAGETGQYYGLRWAGNHVGDLKPLMDSGNLVVNNATTKPITTVLYDETADETYVTVVDSLPLTAVGKNLTIEVSADDPTVVINPEDLEAGSFDPNGYTIVEYLINSTDDTTPDQPYVTLTGLGDYKVTLLVKNDNVPADIDSTECTVSLVESPVPTSDNVTWSGGASLTGMERPEWIWGSNWVGGNAPQNPTSATVTFTSLGAGTNQLSGSRAIVIGERAEPFLLYDGDQIGIDANGTLTSYTFSVDQFADIAAITAQEIVDILNADAAGFQASAVDGKIVILSDAGTANTLQVVDLVAGTAARLGLPTDPASAKRMVGAIEFLNPLNSGYDVLEHTTDLNGQSLTITNELRSGWYADEQTDHKAVTGTFINGNLTLGAADAPIDVLLGHGGYAGKSTASLVFGQGVTLNDNIGTLYIGRGRPGGESHATVDLRNAVLADGVLNVENLYMLMESNANEGYLLFGPDSNVQSIEVTSAFNAGMHAFNDIFIGDPDTQMLPPNVSIKVGDSLAGRGEFIFGNPGYFSGNATLAAAAGGTFDAYVTDFVVGRNRSPYGFSSPVVTVDASAMDSCSIDAENMEIGTTDQASGSGTNTILLALPQGTAAVDTLTMGAPGYNEASTAKLQLNSTQFTVGTSATLHIGSTVDVQLDGTSSGLDLDAFATLTVDDGAAINVTFAAASTSDPYYGIRWAGDHQTELQALIDAGKITADTTAAGADAVVFADDTYTYFGVQSAAPTWPIEGDANMDCKVNIIDLIFVRNRLNKDVTTGDNWQADVNSDGKVNIIDLIYVRNRLNNKCTP